MVQAARDRTTRPSPAIHRPGPLVKTSAGASNWNAPMIASSITCQPKPIQPATARIANGQPAVEPERPVAGGVRQGHQRQRRDADQEDEDARCPRGRCPTGR